RRHANKRKGSKNREKARRKVARLHARIADCRRDFQHKLTEVAHRKHRGLSPSCEAGFSLALALVLPIALCSNFRMKKRTTIWLDEADKAAIAAIKERYGTATESDAVRLAIRLLAHSKHVDIHDGKQER